MLLSVCRANTKRSEKLLSARFVILTVLSSGFSSRSLASRNIKSSVGVFDWRLKNKILFLFTGRHFMKK